MLDIKKAIEQEKIIRTQLDVLKEEIVKKVSAGNNDNCMVIKTSDLRFGILSPDYYIPSAQARIVKNKIEKIETASAFLGCLREMISKKEVCINKTRYRLNENTIKILKQCCD